MVAYALACFPTAPIRHILPPALADRLPAGPGWLHEIKFEGYRVIARRDGEQVRLWARTTSDYSKAFTRIRDAVAALPVESAVLDGEVIILRPDSGVASLASTVLYCFAEVSSTMRRRDLIILLAASAWVQASRGESPRPPVVGLLSNSSPDEQRRGLMPQALRDLGYVEGQNIRFEYRAAGGDDRASARSCDRTCHGRCHRHRFLRYSGDASRAESDKHNTYCRGGDGRSQQRQVGAKLRVSRSEHHRKTFLGPELVPKGWDISRNLFRRSLGSACFGTRKRTAIRP